MTIPTNQAEKIRQTASNLTSARFELAIVEDNEARFGKPDWIMKCREITQANKIPYVNVIWRQDGQIQLESVTLGNSSELLESEYGEEAVISVMDSGMTDFSDPKFRETFLKPFPAVKQRLDGYEEIVKRVSTKFGTRLGITYDGGKGLVVFYLNATIEEGPVKLVVKRIEKALRGLKEAYREIKALDMAAQQEEGWTQ